MLLIYPYKTASKSAKALADAMNVPLIGRDIQLINGKPSITVVNWGSGEPPAAVNACRVLNKPAAVNIAVNKLSTFNTLQAANVRTVPWSSNQADAQLWLKGGFKVCARTKVEGKDGDGLILLEGHKTDWFGRPLPLPAAPVYTKFIGAQAEYRVNVCGNRTMGVQKKVPTGDNPNHDIKTGGNGYGFRLLAENEIPTGIRPVARAAITALGLDFGGVDVIVGVDGNVYVLEVNTAPELTPAMVTAYAAKLKVM
jgi:glutathione synthase/RimK-type ligase-like ATP-grasp enzyme